MADEWRSEVERVGPVLITGSVGDAIIAAIAGSNPDALVLTHASYSRVLVPGRCVVSRADVEAQLGRRVTFPSDLEKVMPSFKGAFRVTDEQAEWVWLQ